ncbi:hypothetical protein [Streptomyces varsoviensis]|uniref:hypothetical protein n=1 Tax=Streptomyces varsoviensis TaxID=67373 RepID=UPI0012FF033B|nr:hypothetical protein [Streptomyces varsoviensis]
MAVAIGLLCAAQFADGAALADAPDGGMETHHGNSLVTIDNSNADSWLEVDRTLNVLAPLSKGTAGSDHDGGGGAIEQHLSRSDGHVQAAPREQADEEEEDEEPQGGQPQAGQVQGTQPRSGQPQGGESAATGGDDPEGDADHGAAPPVRAETHSDQQAAPAEQRDAGRRYQGAGGGQEAGTGQGADRPRGTDTGQSTETGRGTDAGRGAPVSDARPCAPRDGTPHDGAPRGGGRHQGAPREGASREGGPTCS